MDRTPYRTAVRLHGLAEIYWSEIDADNIHVDLLELPAHRLMNVIHTWFKRKMTTEENLQMFETMLEEPFDWEKKMPPKPTSGDDEIALMRAAMGA